MTTRGAALRVSLLVAMGIVPAAACSGSTEEGPGTPSSPSAGQGGESAGEAGSGAGAQHAPGGNDAGGDGAGGIASRIGVCTSPQVDPVTGLVKCSEGFSHRPMAKSCERAPTGAGGAGGEAGGAGAGGAGAELLPAPLLVRCDTDPSVCSQFLNGYCATHSSPFVQARYCASACVTDTDCAGGTICVCGANGSPMGACLPGDCGTDEDCGKGLCATYQDVCGGVGFTCQSPRDACLDNDDCEGIGTCNYSPSGDLPPSKHRYCDQAACGRPFLVQNEARVAPVTRSAAWHANERLKPRLDHLSEPERASLAAHWTKLGQLEHASIAAFARFSLQLLALGAPPDLVEGCTQALADETAHTKLCFELASAYAGRAIGPGPLDIDGSLAASSLSDIVDLVLAEGCFGETSAALEAFEAAESAVDPVIAAAYAQIAADEQRHAELAFRFVRWALEHSAESVAARIAYAIHAPPAASAATREVTLPCLRALLTRFGHDRSHETTEIAQAFS